MAIYKNGVEQTRVDVAAVQAEVDAIDGDGMYDSTMVGTNGAATVANGWDSALATILDNFSATNIGYLDQLDFDLATAIGAIPTTMVGTNGAAIVSDGWDAALATILDNFNATRIGDLDELASANMPTDLDTVKGLVDTAETDSSHSYTDGGGEQDVYTDAVATRRKISFAMDISAMAQGGVVKVYLKVDGTNYRIWVLENVDSISSGGSEDAYTIEVTTNQHFKVSYTEDVDETAARAIPYSVVTQVLE